MGDIKLAVKGIGLFTKRGLDFIDFKMKMTVLGSYTLRDRHRIRAPGQSFLSFCPASSHYMIFSETLTNHHASKIDTINRKGKDSKTQDDIPNLGKSQMSVQFPILKRTMLSDRRLVPSSNPQCRYNVVVSTPDRGGGRRR